MRSGNLCGLRAYQLEPDDLLAFLRKQGIQPLASLPEGAEVVGVETDGWSHVRLVIRNAAPEDPPNLHGQAQVLVTRLCLTPEKPGPAAGTSLVDAHGHQLHGWNGACGESC